MKILEYEYYDPSSVGWKFSRVVFNDINLLVGNSGMGKTRILNTIFNLGTDIANKNIRPGVWHLILEIQDIKYEWNLKVDIIDNKKPMVIFEKLVKIVENSKTILINRSKENFLYNNKKLPRLSSSESAISILQEEKEINELYQGFSKILRRSFFKADLEERCRIEGFPYGLLDKISESKKIQDLYPDLHSKEFNLNAVFYVLLKGFPETFSRILEIYKSVFKFINDIKIKNIQELDKKINVGGHVPIFCVKEKNVDKWIRLDELSSGMQKVLLILVDIFTLPNGSIYLVDEYENSLGVNAINFFPNILIEDDFEVQFFITSHHPYIVNKIPMQNWYVFHRKGSEVKILYGDKVIERYGRSKQQAFIKLLNDSFFTEGVE